MAVLSSNRIAWNYTDDDGNVWRVAASQALVAQAKQGGSASSGTVPQRPGAWPLRRTTVSDGAGHSRVVVVYEITAPIVTKGTTINYNANVAGVITEVTGTSNGGFIREGKKPNVTKQTT